MTKVRREPREGSVPPDPSPAPRMPTAEEWTEMTRAHIDLIARERGNAMNDIKDMLNAFANAVTDADTVGEVMDLVKETAPRFEKWRSTPREGEVMAYGFPPIPKEPTPLDRIAIALERLVELAEQAEPEPEMDVDIEIDADGKLMHVTAEGLARADTAFDTSMHDLSAYVLAHDPDAAARAALTWWSENGHVGITGVKVNYDE